MTGHWDRGGGVHLIAHRGASAYAPANSLDAVAAAAEHGATDVEVDLHSCSDGRFAITHDGTIAVGADGGAASDGSSGSGSGSRSGPAARWISQLSSTDYARLVRDAGREPVFLEDILERAAANGLGLYLDIKQLLPSHEVKLERVIADFDYADRIVAASFRSDIALTVKRGTGLPTSVLFYDPDLDLHSLVTSTGCDFVHPCFDVFGDPMQFVTAEWREAVRSTGAGMITWNTLSVDDAAALMALDVDGICSDDPAILVAARAGRDAPS